MSLALPLVAALGLWMFSRPAEARAHDARPAARSRPAAPSKPATRREAARKLVDASKRHAVADELDSLRELAKDAVRKFERDADRDEAPPAKAAPAARVAPKVPPKAVPPKAAPAARVTPAAPAKAPTASTAPGAPDGTDFGAARRTAQKVSAHLVSTGRDGYDRKLLSAWQKSAGITADGIYGGGTAGALRFYVSSAPGPYFKPVTIAPYKWSQHAR